MPTTLLAPRSFRTAGLLAALGACDGTGPCRVESLRVTLPATIDRGGQTTTADLSYEAGVGFFENIAAFQSTRTFLTGDASRFAGSIAWFFGTDVQLTVVLQGPRVPGDLVPVSTGVFVGRWGPLAPPNGAPASVALTAQNFSAWHGEGSVTGTIEVLAVAPLRLRVDVLATNGTGEEIRVRGDMVAEALGNALGCD
jgi:hypothetical protein